MALVLALFVAIRLAEPTGHLPVSVSSFADDLLCLPLVLGFVLWFHRRPAGRGAHFTLPRAHGLVTLVLFALFFEGLLPRWNSGAVADPWDLLMYLVGLLIFEVLMNKPEGGFRWGRRREFA